MESIKQHLDILECVLPRVMNCIVIEYMFSIYTEKKIFTKKVIHNYNTREIIKNNNVYVFDVHTTKLKMQPINDYNIISTHDVTSFAFDGKIICVCSSLFDTTLYIFNERCEQIRSITIVTESLFGFVILNNMIYVRNTGNNISVYNMLGERVDDIQFTCGIYGIQTSNSYLYVLSSNKTILKLVNNGSVIDECYINMLHISFFNIIDDEIYIICYNMDDVFVYDFSGNIIRKIIIKSPYKINTDKNILYIHTDDVVPHSYLLHQYSRKKINVYKTL